MKVFVTGATGFLGFAIVEELIDAGHRVSGLARSSHSSETLTAVGAEVRLGDIEDLHLLRGAASEVDAVVHTAFYHQISHIPFGTRLKVLLGGLPAGIVGRFLQAAVRAERHALEVMGEALSGRGGSMITAFPTMSMEPGVVAFEKARPSSRSAGALRGENEAILRDLAPQVRSCIVRLPPIVHGTGDRNGLLPQLIKIARKAGRSGYIDEGANRWAAVHKLDAACLFRLALEKGEAGAAYHAVAEEGIAFRDIAEALSGRGATVSISRADGAKQFGFLSDFVVADNPVSSAWTQQMLQWQPTELDTFTDLTSAYLQ